LLGDLPHTLDETVLTIPVGDLYAGQARSFYVEALLPPGREPGETLAMPITATGAEADREPFTAVESRALVRRAPNGDAGGAALVRARGAESQALRADYEGDGARGADVLLKCIRMADHMDAVTVADLTQLAEQMGRGQLSPLESKKRHARSWFRRTQT